MQSVLTGSRTAPLAGRQQQQQQHVGSRHAAFRPGCWRAVSQRRPLRCRAEAGEGESAAAAGTQTEAAPQQQQPTAVNVNLDKEVSKFARNAATTFAPRASGSTGKNPAYKGSTLYTVFEVQAWLSVVVGALLSYNVLLPSDEPNVARLMGMWMIWMMTIPSLRARECTDKEKDALNLLFLAIPLVNITLPFIWKSFPFIFTADCIVMAGVYAWKGLIPGMTFATEEQK